jgi:hypothetical protein
MRRTEKPLNMPLPGVDLIFAECLGRTVALTEAKSRYSKMPFYLQVEVDSSIAPAERWTRVVGPLEVALAKEGLGRVFFPNPLDPENDELDRGTFEISVGVTDIDKARAVVENVLRSVGSGGNG